MRNWKRLDNGATVAAADAISSSRPCRVPWHCGEGRATGRCTAVGMGDGAVFDPPGGS